MTKKYVAGRRAVFSRLADVFTDNSATGVKTRPSRSCDDAERGKPDLFRLLALAESRKADRKESSGQAGYGIAEKANT